MDYRFDEPNSFKVDVAENPKLRRRQVRVTIVCVSDDGKQRITACRFLDPDDADEMADTMKHNAKHLRQIEP